MKEEPFERCAEPESGSALGGLGGACAEPPCPIGDGATLFFLKGKGGRGRKKKNGKTYVPAGQMSKVGKGPPVQK